MIAERPYQWDIFLGRPPPGAHLASPSQRALAGSLGPRGLSGEGVCCAEAGPRALDLTIRLLFGHDHQILQVCPAHRTDLLLRKVDVDRYDDRDLVRTNLIDSYDWILAFVQKHLPDPFYLEGIERRSLRDHIFREVASNMLIHREYASGATSRLIIEYGRVVTDNPSRPHGFGVLDPDTMVPYQKNPILS